MDSDRTLAIGVLAVNFFFFFLSFSAAVNTAAKMILENLSQITLLVAKNHALAPHFTSLTAKARGCTVAHLALLARCSLPLDSPSCSPRLPAAETQGGLPSRPVLRRFSGLEALLPASHSLAPLPFTSPLFKPHLLNVDYPSPLHPLP